MPSRRPSTPSSSVPCSPRGGPHGRRAVAAREAHRARAVLLLDEVAAPGHALERARALDEAGEVLLDAELVVAQPHAQLAAVAALAAVVREEAQHHAAGERVLRLRRGQVVHAGEAHAARVDVVAAQHAGKVRARRVQHADHAQREVAHLGRVLEDGARGLAGAVLPEAVVRVYCTAPKVSSARPRGAKSRSCREVRNEP
jgi:hypothetical protein